MNILVVGSNGQLGNEIKAIHNQAVNCNFFFHDIDTLDITDVSALKTLCTSIKPNFIINCAAYTAVDKAESDTEKAYLINAQAVKNLSNISLSFNSKLIHISTDYVFDGTSYIPYIEEDKVNPTSIYGKSKLEGELALQNNKNAIIIRTSWLYSIYGNNIVKIVRKLASERPEISFIFDQIGSPTYAADLAQAIIHIINKVNSDSSAFIPGIYHFSNEGACSWYDFACETVRLSNLNCKVKPIESKDYPTPVKRPHYSVLNKNKIKTTYDITIPWWRDSLEVCISKL